MRNWRDYGGYPGSFGRLVARCQLYRCAAPAGLSESERRLIGQVSFAAVVDLRGAAERHNNPTFWPGFSAPVFSVDGETAGRFQLPGGGLAVCDAAHAHQAMLRAYEEMPYRPGLLPAYRAYFHSLAVSRGPTLLYCAAGKDRTGLAVALLQHLLGVCADDIMAEYLLTNTTARSERSQAAAKHLLHMGFAVSLTPEASLVFGSVRPEYLRTALQVIAARSGSIDAYLRDVLGVTPEARSAIQGRLLVSRPS